MKYQSNITKFVYDFNFELSHKKRYSCPECSKTSKRKNPLDLEYYPDTKLAYCHKCNATFFEYKQYERKQDYIIPEWKNKTDLTDKSVKWFTARGISQVTLNKMKIYSDQEFMPQFSKEIEVICFPYFIDNKLVNIKFRGANKTFKFITGAELTWFNFDALRTNKEIIICEGEIDALSWIENGFENVISVPNGANLKLEYLDNTIDFFIDIEKIYLATDTDTPGLKLRDELIRRLGAERCFIVNLKQYKDSNDYLCGLGGLEFKNLIKDSKPVPVKGIVEINSLYSDVFDLYENGISPGLFINNNSIDDFISWDLGLLAIITGIPSSGKSEFIDYIITRLNLLHGWKAALFTPENYPLKYHYRKLHEKISGKKFDKKIDDTDFLSIFEYINNNFFYILDEEDMSVEKVIESAKFLVKQKGIKILVIDPYNRLEHNIKNNTKETDYISKFLDTLTRFARFNNVLIFLIAHPQKMQRDEVPTMYSISGSANFFNKADYGLTVHRERNENGSMSNSIELHIQKVRFKHLGKQGCAQLNYNYNNGRFEPGGAIDRWDNSNWLVSDSILFDNSVNVNEDFEGKGDDIPF